MIKKNPAIFLLILVYFFFIPPILSYENSWVQPEEYYLKLGILKTGPQLNVQDIKTGLSWELFEYKPRLTRPFSYYFEIMDTKFRVWLWHFIPPIPSLSLTWIFSFILAPLFLYFLLINCSVRGPVAVTMVAFYLMTPAVLSYEAMLFRPAKPMVNFFIILCLFLASRLKVKYLDQKNLIPWQDYLYFWFSVMFSFYWDETGLLIFPAVIFFFPQIFKRKSYLFLWLLLPLIVGIMYFKVLPYLSSLAGYTFPLLSKYDLINYFGNGAIFLRSFRFLGINAGNLILETMGLIIPDCFFAPWLIAVFFYASLIAWGIILFYAFKEKQKADGRVIFLAGMIILFNFLTYITMRNWGPWYYGSYWSVFFVLWLATLISQSKIPDKVLVICFCFILIGLSNSFIATNKIAKKYHYYPYNPWIIAYHFSHHRFRFETEDKLPFSATQIKSIIYQYWQSQKEGKRIDSIILPRELAWLPIELKPGREHAWQNLLFPDYKNYIEDK